MAHRLPHISRLFTATTLQRVSSVSIRAVLLFSLMYLYSTNILLALPYSNTASDVSRHILSSPFDAKGHMVLAEYYKDSANDAKKSRELAIARELALDTASILGTSTDITTTIQGWENEPDQLEKKLEYWRRITLSHPDYRDAYLQASFYASKLKLSTRAETYLQQAKELDPLH